MIKEFDDASNEAFAMAGGSVDLSDEVKLSLARNKMRISFMESHNGWEDARVLANTLQNALSGIDFPDKFY